MTLKLANNIIVPTAPDAFRPTADLKVMGDSANVAIYVNTQAERDALTAVKGMVCARGDLPGVPLQTYDGAKWTISDTPWTTLALVQGFSHLNTSGWSGLKYRVKNGQVTVTGAVSRATTWAADLAFAVIPTALKPAIKTAGMNCEIEPTVGNIVMNASGINARSVFVTWPLD